LKNQCVGQAELVIDVSNHGERVGACDEVLLDYDCSSSTCPFESADFFTYCWHRTGSPIEMGGDADECDSVVAFARGPSLSPSTNVVEKGLRLWTQRFTKTSP